MRSGRGMAPEGGAKGRVRDERSPGRSGEPLNRSGSSYGTTRGAGASRGSRDERGRQARPDAAASGKGRLGEGYKGEMERGRERYNDGKKKAPTHDKDNGLAKEWRGGGGFAVDRSLSSHNIDGYEPRHTRKTR